MDEAEEIVQRARMWRWKPYGEVTIRFAQDANGAPVELMQDPLHYPHGTKFMAPGPLGQCHPLPDDRCVVGGGKGAKRFAALPARYNIRGPGAPGAMPPAAG